MGIGIVSLQTSQKREQAGPPFASDSADNGLSVDSVTGRIVLGNDVGDPAAPAALLSNREILTDDGITQFSLQLNSPTNLVTTTLEGVRVLVSGQANTAPSVEVVGGDTSTPQVLVQGAVGGAPEIRVIAGAGGSGNLTLQAGAGGSTTFTSRVSGDIFTFTNNGTDDFEFSWSNFAIGVTGMRFYGATIQIQVGPTLQTKNAADFQISGTTTYRRTVESNGGPTYNIDRNLDSGKLFRNSGAVNFVLPNMAGANSRPGFVFRCRVFNAAGVTITAVGIAINFGSLVTGATGTLFSTDVGACITITYDVDGWVTESFVGAWGLT